MRAPRYPVVTTHGEIGSCFYVVDSAQPLAEQPCVVRSWCTATEPNARYLADDFCQRHNDKEKVCRNDTLDGSAP